MSYSAAITFLNVDVPFDTAFVEMLVSRFELSTYTLTDNTLFYDSSSNLADMLVDEETFVSIAETFPNIHCQMKISSFGYDRFSFIELCGSQNICVRKHFSWYKGLVDIDGEDIEDLYQEWFSSTLDFCAEMPQDVLENELSFEQFVAACFFEY